MCGIAGIVRLRPGPAVGQEQLERMLATMLHRGPDDSGIFLTDECGLGARRLSIVDLTGGHQPMVTDGGHLAVVQNGEIYNYPALRRDLTAAGCDFHTTCDTEVLLHAYRAWGLDMVGRLRGMIAFALWYWEFDRGGPGRRSEGIREYPDFLFPQMQNPDLAPKDWEPSFVDYLYLSFTNATAFSPTDVMPLTHRAKAGMMVESAISATTVLLAAARAVNILR